MTTAGDLAGQVAVVTGAASGIGRAMVESFAGAGAKIVAADIAADRLAELEAPDVVTKVADLTDMAQVAATVDLAVERFGRIDILVNNAGGPDRMSAADDCTDEEWDHGYALYAKGPFVAIRHALAHMLPAGRGLILNVASIAGLGGGHSGVAYTSAKAALIGLSRNTAVMYAENGIRCIAICPGYTATGASAKTKAMRESGQISERTDLVRDRTRGTYLRAADPAEFGRAALFLATGGADLFNGSVLTADSGSTAHGG